MSSNDNENKLTKSVLHFNFDSLTLWYFIINNIIIK